MPERMTKRMEKNGSPSVVRFETGSLEDEHSSEYVKI